MIENEDCSFQEIILSIPMLNLADWMVSMETH